MALGLAEYMRISPEPETKGWAIAINRISLVAPESKYEPEGSRGGQYWESRVSPDRRGLSDAVSDSLRYPSNLLRAEPDAVRAYLEAWRGRRALTTAGILRGRYEVASG